MVIYLGVMAIISSSRGHCWSIPEPLGFIINKEKSVLIPSQKIVFLGYAIVYLSQLARNSLQCFVVNGHLYNGTRISKPSKVVTMTTDAPDSGWGVVCDGVSSRDLWSAEVQAMHVNWLQLSAVLFSVKCFVHSHNCLVSLL